MSQQTKSQSAPPPPLSIIWAQSVICREAKKTKSVPPPPMCVPTAVSTVVPTAVVKSQSSSFLLAQVQDWSSSPEYQPITTSIQLDMDDCYSSSGSVQLVSKDNSDYEEVDEQTAAVYPFYHPFAGELMIGRLKEQAAIRKTCKQ